MSDSVVISKTSKCPCGSALKYIKCCGQYIKQNNKPLTAEALMRSRYTAYVLKNEAYLLNSWHGSTRPRTLDLDRDQSEWLKLEVLKTEAGNSNNIEGVVEFIAYFKTQGKRNKIHEVSQFLKENNQWYYVDGMLES